MQDKKKDSSLSKAIKVRGPVAGQTKKKQKTGGIQQGDIQFSIR